MAGRKPGKRILTALIVIHMLIFSLGLLLKFTDIFQKDFTIVYNGTKIVKNVENLEIIQGTEIEVKLKNKGAGYKVKVYAVGDADFTFTVEGKEYRWKKDVAGAELSEVLLQRTEKGFKVMGGVLETLRDMYGTEVELPEKLPSGDLFRLNVTSGEKLLTIGFSVKLIAVEKVELQPGELVF